MMTYCIWAVVEKRKDGSIICPLLESGTWECEECMEILDRQEEREDD